MENDPAITESTAALLTDFAAAIAHERHGLELIRDGIGRGDPRGRHLSLAITALEDAELRLARGASILPTLQEVAA